MSSERQFHGGIQITLSYKYAIVIFLILLSERKYFENYFTKFLETCSLIDMKTTKKTYNEADANYLLTTGLVLVSIKYY